MTPAYTGPHPPMARDYLREMAPPKPARAGLVAP
jgi:hypothetical protein